MNKLTRPKIILLVGTNNTGKSHFISNKILPINKDQQYFIIDPYNEYLDVSESKKDTSFYFNKKQYNNVDFFKKRMLKSNALIIEGCHDKRIIGIEPVVLTRHLNCSLVFVFNNFVDNKESPLPKLVRFCSPKYLQLCDKCLFFGSKLTADNDFFEKQKNDFGFDFLIDMRNYIPNRLAS